LAKPMAALCRQRCCTGIETGARWRHQCQARLPPGCKTTAGCAGGQGCKGGIGTPRESGPRRHDARHKGVCGARPVGIGFDQASRYRATLVRAVVSRSLLTSGSRSCPLRPRPMRLPQNSWVQATSTNRCQYAYFTSAHLTSASPRGPMHKLEVVPCVLEPSNRYPR
jgi:hypothetical protein